MIDVEGYVPPRGQKPEVEIHLASPGYFRTMGIPLREGRFFPERDNDPNHWVAIVDENLAQRFWPHGKPIGKRLLLGPVPASIVGVVGVVKYHGLDQEGRSAVYFPERLHPENAMYLVARTALDEARTARAIVRAIHAIDSDVLVTDVRTFEDRLNDSLAR
jgi:putative ABC transport system permease protein